MNWNNLQPHQYVSINSLNDAVNKGILTLKGVSTSSDRYVTSNNIRAYVNVDISKLPSGNRWVKKEEITPEIISEYEFVIQMTDSLWNTIQSTPIEYRSYPVLSFYNGVEIQCTSKVTHYPVTSDAQYYYWEVSGDQYNGNPYEMFLGAQEYYFTKGYKKNYIVVADLWNESMLGWSGYSSTGMYLNNNSYCYPMVVEMEMFNGLKQSCWSDGASTVQMPHNSDVKIKSAILYSSYEDIYGISFPYASIDYDDNEGNNHQLYYGNSLNEITIKASEIENSSLFYSNFIN